MSNAILSSTNQKTETFFERHAWIIFLVLSVLLGLAGVGHLTEEGISNPAIAKSITGETWEELRAASPTHANLVNLFARREGADFIVIALLSMAVSLTGFRRGERWAWYALWVGPLRSALTLVLFFTAGRQPGSPVLSAMISPLIGFVVSILALALSYGKFFRKQ